MSERRRKQRLDIRQRLLENRNRSNTLAMINVEIANSESSETRGTMVIGTMRLSKSGYGENATRRKKKMFTEYFFSNDLYFFFS